MKEVGQGVEQAKSGIHRECGRRYKELNRKWNIQGVEHTRSGRYKEWKTQGVDQARSGTGCRTSVFSSPSSPSRLLRRTDCENGDF